MASEAAVEAILKKALNYCRRHDPEDIEAAIQTWSNLFADAPSADLAKAVDQWIANLTEEERGRKAQILPYPADIRRLMDAAKPKPPDRRPSSPWVPASREYADDHKVACQLIANLGTSGLTTLATNLFTTEAPVKRRAAAGDVSERRDAMRKIIATLPTPSEVAFDCRCDGSGFIDTEQSREAIHDVEPGVREVRPCPKCNRPAWERWRNGDYGMVKS